MERKFLFDKLILGLASAVKISAVIVTLNEERNIDRCLSSLKDIVDEIVVLDSFSTDNTENICRKHEVVFLKKEWRGYSESKNYANARVRYDYILSLDGDEALSEELRASILELKNNHPADAYYINRRTNYCGKWIKHCGWYPDKKLRLWNRSKGNWQGILHEKIVMSPGISSKDLSGDILHYSFHSIGDHLITANNFSQIAAREAYNEGKKINLVIHLMLNPLFTFLRKYILQLGFLDGYYGYIICRISAFANFLKYSKVREMYKNAR